MHKTVQNITLVKNVLIAIILLERRGVIFGVSLAIQKGWIKLTNPLVN